MALFDITDSTYGADTSLLSNSSAIQAAIDAAASAGGGIVIIPSGTYNFDTGITLKANVVLKGYGGILNYIMPTPPPSGALYPIHNLDGHPNVTIDGIIVNGNNDINDYPIGGVVDSITIGGENCVIKNCHIINPIDSGIMFSGAKNGLCVNNRIENLNPNRHSDLGIYINDGNGSNAYQNLISGNRISGFRAGGIGLKRISQKVIVSSNLISNCGNGITLENASTSSDFSRDIQITNNRISKIGYNPGDPIPAGRGIDLRASDFSIASNNRIEDTKGQGILIQGTNNSIISDNVITLTNNSDPQLGRGIELTSRLVSEEPNIGSKNNVIKGNIITGSTIGIYINGKDSPIEFNKISSNNITSCTYCGLLLEGNPTHENKFNMITDNIINNCDYRGLLIKSDANVINTFINNNIIGGKALLDAEYFFNSDDDKNNLSNNIYVNNSISGHFQYSSKGTYLTFGNKVVSSGNRPPVNGNWNTGDIVFNTEPNTAEYIGWACVASGSPGTWKGFGLIQ